MALSIIIPALNEEVALPHTLQAIARLREPVEVIVADGGSSDRTVAIATSFGVRVIETERGRGRQLGEGARQASGDVLLFLHADALLDGGAPAAMLEALRDSSIGGGNFTLRFDGGTRAARLLTIAYPYFRLMGLCYGDSGIFARRAVYEELGGFRPYPLFEDVDFVWRLKRKSRFTRLRCPLTVSSRRFEGRSFALTFAHWTGLQILFWAGVPPERLAKWYANIRGGR